MRVAIVNDLAVACEALRRVLATEPSLSVAWIARDGAEAVECARRDRPDLVLMDLIMPRMDGVAATREIMRVAPCPILVVTATVSGNAALVYEALGAGALDAVNTPTIAAKGAIDGAAELVRRIRLIARVQGAPAPQPSAVATRSAVASARPAAIAPFPARAGAIPRIVAIGASTGGPRAIAAVLATLPRPMPFAVAIVQHVSSEFVAGFAEWLAAESRRSVRLARAGDRLAADDIVVAGEDRHLVITPDGAIAYSDEPRESLHRPAVDEFFSSLARHAAPGVAVLLTGMGRDGAEGLARLRAAGWHTIAQDEASSVVWGMPGTAHRMGAAVETLPLEGIGAAVGAAAAIRSR
ncbi:MAG: chemotaxis-specific protein-glutamate methyltransferase CheB [Planctomycetota bacterium]|nr:chemotaxis-specific protein-glutamate methyltransferase CheB [Planctomycetota bacterium]